MQRQCISTTDVNFTAAIPDSIEKTEVRSVRADRVRDVTGESKFDILDFICCTIILDVFTHSFHLTPFLHIQYHELVEFLNIAFAQRLICFFFFFTILC